MPRPPSRDVALYRSGTGPLGEAGLHCIGFGLQRISRWVATRTLDSFAAVFIARGEGALHTAATGQLPVRAPALFWLHPATAHRYGPAPGTDWDERWALFGGGLATTCRAAGLLDPARPLAQPVDAVEIAALFDTLHSDVLDDSPAGRLAAGATLCRLIARGAAQRPAAAGKTARGDLEGAVAALKARAFGPVDIAAVAAEFGFSPAGLRRRVQAAHGAAPMALVTQWRCARAKELLATTLLGITDIADATGFADPYYFSRVFARREHCSPSAFRVRHQRG